LERAYRKARPMTLTPLHPEIVLDHPEFDEVRDFTSLVVRIRDKNDKDINVDFERYLIYRKMDETRALDHHALARPINHWLYEIEGSEFLEDFKKRNPHARPSHDLGSLLGLGLRGDGDGRPKPPP
jgi:hypothetical protein